MNHCLGQRRNEMKRLTLYLPVCRRPLPLLVYPWLAPAFTGERALAQAGPPAAAVIADKDALPDGAEMEKLARTDPLAFLENCLRRYRRDVQGYRLTMQ